MVKRLMLRRSSRLDVAGYYNLQGEPVNSYKETYRRPKKFAPDSQRDTTKKTVRSVPEAKEASGANEASGATRASWNIVIRWLFYMLPVCLGIVNFSPALYMNSTSLDSGPLPLPVPPTKLDTTVLSRTEGLEQQVRMLQDELLKLRRINELPPWHSMPNVALESQGARVLAQLSSKTYQSTKPSLFIRFWKFLIPSWRPAADPSIVTQGGPIMVGRCWPFHGERGHLVIALSQKVTISHVTLGHISKTVSPTGNISSAPKMFAVYGMKTKEDEGTLLGNFLYDQNGESVQDFKLSDQEEGVFSHVKLKVESNWGNPDYTCVYNFRVLGII
ncbi:SUN domain-containing protein 1-like [Sebastes umbrosus]|uniref:SUN domain-containing protein 1-like n=1 Tax=Sebastes umbrosus TaxID=72105 RepID=UPI0018A07A96|nr:SUN domain-containing protein 1-like [Sebastes umbrosus]XP_037625602.1 SUN domain-containing protein 1-like [Sebastes umbrosus]